MRVVLDANILLAGLATRGLCEALLTLCFQHHTVVLSDHILEEVRRHYINKFKATAERADKVVSDLREESQIVSPCSVPTDAFEDPDDLPVLGTAVAARAEALVTGDKALLELGQYEGIPILSPREFYDRIRTGPITP